MCYHMCFSIVLAAQANRLPFTHFEMKVMYILKRSRLTLIPRWDSLGSILWYLSVYCNACFGNIYFTPSAFRSWERPRDVRCEKVGMVGSLWPLGPNRIDQLSPSVVRSICLVTYVFWMKHTGWCAFQRKHRPQAAHLSPWPFRDLSPVIKMNTTFSKRQQTTALDKTPSS